MKMSIGANTELLAKGALVEVTSDEEGFHGSWFLAKVLELDAPPKKMEYLVEYQHLLSPDGNELLRELVPSKFVRPLLPTSSSKETQQRFQANDVVEAYHNEGWWVGAVSKVAEEEPRIYSVSFEKPYHVLKFESSQLRFHLDWDGHKWVQPEKLKKTISKGQEMREEKKEAETSSQKRKRGKLVKSSLKGAKARASKKCDAAEGGVDKTLVKNSPTIGVESAITGDSIEKVTGLCDTSSKVQDAEMADVISNRVDIDEDNSMCSQTFVVDSKAAPVDNMSFENPNSQFSESSHMEEFQLMPQKLHFHPLDEREKKKTISKGKEMRKEKKEAETSSQKRKRRKLVKSSFKGKECDGAQGGVDKILVKNSSTIGVESSIAEDGTEEGVELSDTGSKGQDAEMTDMISNRVDVDKDKSMCYPTILVDPKAATVDNMSFENPNLRFLESSPVLKVVQSMEEFQLMPQKPHFRPLDECEEVCQEGLVLAHMMTFVNVVKETSKLRPDSSRSMMESLLKCLPELESHGFFVEDVRSRLLKLQSMKTTQEELQTKLEKAECEIKTWTCNTQKMKEELDDAMKEMKMLEEKIKVAEEKRTGLTLMNEEKDSVIAKLRSSDDLLNEDIQKLEHNFASLAASPWK